MAENKNIQAFIEDSEDALFQTIIDRQEGALGIEESEALGPAQSGAVLDNWEQALNKLESRTAHPRRMSWKKAFLVAALILLLLTVAAYAARMFGLFINVQETFTQLTTEQGPASIIKNWTGAPIPTQLPAGFFISDATEGDGVRFIEYVNAEKKRFSIYLYDTGANVSLDTENADQQSQIELDGLTVYLVEKNGLTTLYWSTNANIISIEFCPEDISLDEIKAVAASMVASTD